MSCKCQNCNEQYKIDLLIPNNLWSKIRPGQPKSDKESGLLCGSCIMSKLEKLLKTEDYFFLRKT